MAWIDGPVVGKPIEFQLSIGYELNKDGSAPGWRQAYLIRINFTLGKGPRPVVLAFQLPPGTQTPDGRTGRIEVFNGYLDTGGRPASAPVLSVFTLVTLVPTVTLAAIATVVDLTGGVIQGTATVNLPLQIGPRPAGTVVFRQNVPMFDIGPPVGQLWSMDVKSGARSALVASPTFETMYSVADASPKEKKLAFIAGSGPMFGRTDLMTASSSDGKSLSHLYGEGELFTWPRWSPDGNRILLTLVPRGGSTWALYVLDVTSRRLKPATDGNQVKWGVWMRGGLAACLETANVGTANAPIWLDGATIVVSDDQFNGEVARYQMDPAWRRFHLASSQAHDVVAFSASVYGGDPRNQTGSEIHVFDLGSAIERNLGEGAMPAFSPDGHWIVYSKRSVSPAGAVSTRLWTMDVTGNNAKPLSPEGVLDEEPTWLPEG